MSNQALYFHSEEYLNKSPNNGTNWLRKGIYKTPVAAENKRLKNMNFNKIGINLEPLNSKLCHFPTFRETGKTQK